MTTGVSEFGARTLDFTGDSIQLLTRKGADLIWIHRFEDQNGAPLNINNWTFTTGMGSSSMSLGQVRNGVDAQGMPQLVPIDIKLIDTDSTETDYMIDQVVYTASSTTLSITFEGGTTPPIPANRFFRLVVGVQTFFFTSDMAIAGGGWQIIGPTGMNLTDVNDNQGYTLQQRPHEFGLEDAIQCYFRTRDLDNVNPSSGRSNNAPFEIEADIDSGLTESDDTTPITVRQVVASGVVTVFSDVYTAPIN